MEREKPLGAKAYGSIPHLPGSRLGPGDHTISPGQARICTEKPRDSKDFIVVQEKLDGSCCAVAKIDGRIVPLTRSGYRAETSQLELHQRFAQWVNQRYLMFLDLLHEGERFAGEWLWQAHGIRYYNLEDPWVVFDLFKPDGQRAPVSELMMRVSPVLDTPKIWSAGPPVSIDRVKAIIDAHMILAKPVAPVTDEAILKPEGAVWRVERNEKVEFLAKYVRDDHVPGGLWPSNPGDPPIINPHRWDMNQVDWISLKKGTGLGLGYV